MRKRFIPVVVILSICLGVLAQAPFGSAGPDASSAHSANLEKRVALLERKLRIQAQFNILTITRLDRLESRKLQVSGGVGGSTTIAPGSWGSISASSCLGLNAVPVGLSYQTDYPIWPGSVSRSLSSWRLAAYVPSNGHTASVRAEPVCVTWGY